MRHLATAAEQKTLARADRILTKLAKRCGATLSSPSKAIEYIRPRMEAQESELFVCVWLDSQHTIIDIETMFTGTVDGASVYPREIVKRALDLNAAAVIFAHNHPSGISEPSRADERITMRLQQALNTIDIRVLDHLVIGAGNHTSFAESGRL